MKERAAAGAVTTVGTGAVAVAQLIRAKVYAVALGASGTGLMAQVTASQQVALSIAPLFSGVALVTLIARTEDAREQHRVLRAARGGALIALGVPAALASTLLAAIALLLRADFPLLLALGLVGVPFGALTAVELAGLQGTRRFGRLAIANVMTAVLGVAAAGIGAVAGGPMFAAAGMSLGMMLSWSVSTSLAGGGTWPFSFDIPRTRQLVHLGSAAITSATLASVGQAAIRASALVTLGATAAGFVHAMVSLALQFTFFVNAALGTYAQPRIARAAAAGDRAAVANEIIALRMLGGTFVGVAMIPAAVLAEPVILAFFSSEFVPMAQILPAQLVGELFRAHFWLTGTYLLPMGFRRIFVGIELVVYGSLIPAAVVLAPSLGVAGFAVAHVLSAGIAAILLSAHARRELGIGPLQGIAPFVISVVALLASTVAPWISVALGVVLVIGLRRIPRAA